MSKEEQKFKSVWDALEANPVQSKNLKLRSEIMIAIQEKIEQEGFKKAQAQAAEIMQIIQPRVSVRY